MELSDLSDSVFWGAVLPAATFWRYAALPGLAAATIAAAGTVVLFRAARWRALGQDTRGAVAIIDLVMILPVAFMVLMIFLQFAFLAQEAILVHYAAFAAARSARVNLCPPLSLGGGPLAGQLGCTDRAERAEQAARLALIPAAPASGDVSCLSRCDVPSDMLRALARATGQERQTAAFLAKARYVFDGDNVRTEVSHGSLGQVAAMAGARITVPVQATVTFRHLLLPTIGWAVPGGERRSDGLYTYTSRARLSLL